MKKRSLLALLPIISLFSLGAFNSKEVINVKAEDTFEYEYDFSYDFNSNIGKNQIESFTYEKVDFAPLNEFSTFWSKDAKITPSGTYALTTSSDPFDPKIISCGNFLLEFVHPINTTEFNKIKLTGLHNVGGQSTLKLNAYNY